METKIQQQLDLPPLDQIGLVYRDLDAAIALYEPMFGPFKVIKPPVMTWDYRGEQRDNELKLAFGRSGNIEIELIQWISGESPHKEFIDSGREGMHHLRFCIDDLDSKIREVEQIGYQTIWKKRFGERRAAAYLERKDDPLLIELFENHLS